MNIFELPFFKEIEKRGRGSGGGLVRDLSSLGVLYVVANVFMVLYHVFLSRGLGPEGYSVIGLATSLMSVVLVSFASIHIVMTRFVSYYRTRHQYGKIAFLASRSFSIFIITGFIMLAAFFLLRHQIAEFFHITPLNALSIGLIVMACFLIPVFEGLLRGLQNFYFLGMMYLVSYSATLILAVVFVFSGFNINAPLLAIVLGWGLAFIIGLYPLRSILPLHKEKVKMKAVYAYAWPVLVITLSMALFFNMDLILVKHFFSPEKAGYYAAAALLSNVPFLISMGLAGVMFPKVVERHADGKDTTNLLKKSLKITLGIVGVLGLAYFIFPNFLSGALFGGDYNISTLLGLYVITMGILSIDNVLLLYNLAVKNYNMLFIMPAFLLLEIILITLIHSTLLSVILVLLFLVIALTAVMFYLSWHKVGLEKMLVKWWQETESIYNRGKFRLKKFRLEKKKFYEKLWKKKAKK